jgi:hypothetical protein
MWLKPRSTVAYSNRLLGIAIPSEKADGNRINVDA